MQPAAARCPRPLAGLPLLLCLIWTPSSAIAGQGAASAAQAHGAPLRDLSFEQLGAIQVITPSKNPDDLWGMPAAVWVITDADIRRSGATTLPEVLRMAPGVEVAGIDASHWSVGIRGFGDQFSKPVLVLVDGRNIYTPLFAGTYWPAHDIPLHDIDRIEVIRGPGGALWGGNAVNGVINVITRTAEETRGLFVSVGTGSAEHASAFLRYGGVTDGGAAWRAYARSFLRGPGEHREGAAKFDDDWWLAQAGFRGDWPLSFGTVTLQGEVNDGRHGQRVEVSSFSPPRRRPLDGLVLTSGGHLIARLERDTIRGSVRAQLSYDRVIWDAPHFAETRDTLDFDYSQALSLAGRHGLTFGGGTRWSPGRFRQQLETLSFTPAYHVHRVHNLFVQDEVQLLRDRLALTVGTKLEHNTYTAFEWLPSARLAWTPTPQHTVWAAATRAVRTPSRIERSVSAVSFVSPFGPVFWDVQGSDTFNAEEAVGYEAGFRMLLTSTVSVFASGFHTEHDDLAAFGFAGFRIETTPPPPRAIVQFPHRNGIKGQSSGFEVVPEWRPLPWWRVRGWYAYRRFDFHTKPGIVDPGSVARLDGSSPANQGRIESRITLPAGWEFDAAYRHVGRLRTYGIQSYRTGDLRLGWQATPQIGLSVAGHNLFDPSHLEFPHVAGTRVGMPRRVQAALTWTYATR